MWISGSYKVCRGYSIQKHQKKTNLRQVSPEALLELLRQGAEQLASQPVAEAEFHAAFAELAAGGLRAVRKAEDKELREPWRNFQGKSIIISKSKSNLNLL